jgi:hypothetical protein
MMVEFPEDRFREFCAYWEVPLNCIALLTTVGVPVMVR